MRRTQILLHPHQHAALTARAAREGISLSALIRRLLDASLTQGSSDGGRAWLADIAGIVPAGETTEWDQDRALYEEDAEPR